MLIPRDWGLEVGGWLQGAWETQCLGRYFTLCRSHRPPQLLCWTAVEKYKPASCLVCCWVIQTGIVPGLLGGGFPLSVVHIPPLDYSPSPSPSAALSLEQAAILWLGVLARFPSSLEGPAPPTLTSTQVPVWPGWHLVSAASKGPLRRIHRTQDFLSLLPALLGSPSGVSDLSPCSSWEVGIIPLWIYRDHLLSFIHNNLVLIFVCVRLCMVHSRRPMNFLIRSI